MTKQPGGPHARPAGQLQHAAGRPEVVQRRVQFIAAGKIQALIQVVRGAGRVVGGLLGEDPVELLAA